MKLRIGPTAKQRPIPNQDKLLKLYHPERWKQGLLYTQAMTLNDKPGDHSLCKVKYSYDMDLRLHSRLEE